MQKRIQILSAALLSVGLVGCSNLPGSSKQQGAVIGGATGAAAGAAVAKNNRALGAVIGGAVGAAGGYVIGSKTGKNNTDDRPAVEQAARRAEQNPATAEQARNATTADINGDGFVTMDEVIAMEEAGLTDQQMLERLRSSGQVFRLNEEQKQQLRSRGVSEQVINEMSTMNQQPQDQVTTTLQ
jgi:hypothetical protein